MQKTIRTVGVEEELLLIDPETGIPTAVIEPILSDQTVEENSSENIHLESEVKQEQIEVVSPPRLTMDEIYDSITLGRTKADEAAKIYGGRAVALGTSVISVNSNLVEDVRFEAMRQKYGLTLREQLTCGFHVHVKIESEDEGVAVLDRIRPWLPILLALSANSPMWSGKDTGFNSYRYQAWLRWPTAGVYDIFETPAAYHETVESLISTGAIIDPGMVYFDARLAKSYPTIEIRVADVCLKAEHATALAARVRALVEASSREWKAGLPTREAQVSVLKLASWTASRFGVTESLVCPITDEQISAREAVDLLLKFVDEVLEEQGEKERVHEAIEDIFLNGTGSQIQREVLATTGDPREVVKKAVEISNQHLIQKA